jgi:hypothetical protein
MVKIMFTAVTILACREPKVSNKSGIDWNTHDQKVMEHAKKRCGEKFEGRSPCLIEIVKLGVRDYHVTCGHEVKEDET